MCYVAHLLSLKTERSNNLNVLHLIVRSLLLKVSELKLKVYKTKEAVISATETWSNDTATNVNIKLDSV